MLTHYTQPHTGERITYEAKAHTNTTIQHPAYRHRMAQALNELRNASKFYIVFRMSEHIKSLRKHKRLALRIACATMCRLESELDEAQNEIIASALARQAEAEHGRLVNPAFPAHKKYGTHWQCVCATDNIHPYSKCKCDMCGMWAEEY